MGNIITRKIGDAQVTVAYEEFHKDAKKWANERLDREQAAYEDALQVVENGLDHMVEQLESTHLRLEDIKQNTCEKCGHQTLKERRGRMRVFGGLFWTDSKPSPYKHCDHCGNDQEAPVFHAPHLESLRRQSERRIEQAKRLIAKYQLPQPPSSDLESKVKPISQTKSKEDVK